LSLGSARTSTNCQTIIKLEFQFKYRHQQKHLCRKSPHHWIKPMPPEQTPPSIDDLKALNEGQLQSMVQAMARSFATALRLDRPIGGILLLWPCLWGLTLSGGLFSQWELIPALIAGTLALRVAAGVFDDLINRNYAPITAALRLLPVGSNASPPATLIKSLVIFIVLVGVCGFLLPASTRAVALIWVGLIALFPFVRRIVVLHIPMLGLVMAWGALLGWRAGDVPAPTPFAIEMLFAGTAAWVIGYATLYAMQHEDGESLIGPRPSQSGLAAFGKASIGLFYLIALVLWMMAARATNPQPIILLAAVPVAAHLLWQTITLRPANPDNIRGRFMSNAVLGGVVTAFFAVTVYYR
jgi:4-hydroxybenzoate polyprenyltransferase